MKKIVLAIMLFCSVFLVSCAMANTDLSPEYSIDSSISLNSSYEFDFPHDFILSDVSNIENDFELVYQTAYAQNEVSVSYETYHDLIHKLALASTETGYSLGYLLQSSLSNLNTILEDSTIELTIDDYVLFHDISSQLSPLLNISISIQNYLEFYCEREISDDELTSLEKLQYLYVRLYRQLGSYSLKDKSSEDFIADLENNGYTISDTETHQVTQAIELFSEIKK